MEIFCELDPKEWGEFVNEATKELSREVKVDGFRPGMAPMDLIEQKVGLGRILERAADLAVKKTYVRIILDNKIEAIGHPEIQITKLAKDNPFEFKVKVAVMPEITLGDYRAIAGKEPKKFNEEVNVEEKEIADSLKWLQKSRTKYVTVLRPAKTGDRVEIDFTAKSGGQIIEGGESKNHPLILGEGHFVPGFEDNLVGLKEGETKDFNLVFPIDFKPANLAGASIDFNVKMNLVQAAEVPELTDEFVKSLGKFENKEALEKSVKDGLAQEKKEKAKEIWRSQVLEKISQKSSMEIPAVLIGAEKEKMIQELQSSLMQMGLDFKHYLEDIKKTEEDLKKDWQDKAKQRVSAALILRVIADKERIEPTEEEMENEINKVIGYYKNMGDLEQKIDMERLKEYTKNGLKNQKVFELLENL